MAKAFCSDFRLAGARCRHVVLRLAKRGSGIGAGRSASAVIVALRPSRSELQSLTDEESKPTLTSCNYKINATARFALHARNAHFFPRSLGFHHVPHHRYVLIPLFARKAGSPSARPPFSTSLSIPAPPRAVFLIPN